MKPRKLIGYGGGGGKGGGGESRTPTEDPDSLRSKSFARVVDLLSEGEIEGLVNGAKSIYLDGTRLQNDDGSYNFSGVSWTERRGTQLQSYVPGFAAVENTLTVAVQCKEDVPVVRQFTNPNLNAVRVTIGVPALTRQSTETGDISGTSVTFFIDVQTNGGGFVRTVNGYISGKTTSRYQRSYRIPLTGTGPWDIRVVRASDDSTSTTLQNQTWWDTATEIIDAKLRYPNSALVALSCDAAQFQSIPTRGYDVKLLRVRVPTNYDAATRTYTGSWDGNFQIAWTDNPAWCFYDLITSDRYGLGQFVDASQVDKWALYAIGKYCDQLVPDGFGGTEPRFTCNIYLQTKQEAYKLVNDFATIFRGMAFWSSGSITAVQDAPTDAAALFNPANVIDGTFTYSGSSAKARHTVALVTWNDPEDMYRQKVEYVEDTAGIARLGIVTTEVVAVGCTSRGQANRVGRWLLFTERLESEVVTFKTGLEGAVARPGQVIKVADPNRAGVRFGGRLLAATTTSATLDAPVTLTAGEAYTFSAVKADGTVQEAGVTHSGGTLSTLALSPALAEAPADGSIWLIASATVQAQTFRVLSVAENEKHEFEVTALAHEPGKYAAIEQGLTLEPRSYSKLSAVPPTPANLTLSESLYLSSTGVRIRLSASWSAPDGAVSYIATVQREGDNQSPQIGPTVPTVDFNDVVPGVHTVRVWAVNAVGVPSAKPAVAQYVVLGKVAPPANVQGFTVARSGDTLTFAWRPVPDLDLDRYELRQGLTWATGITVGSTSGTTFSVLAPRGGQFMVKAIDTSGIESASEAVCMVPAVSGINVVLNYNEAQGGWNGAKSNTTEIGVTRNLNWSDLADWTTANTWGDTIVAGGVVLVGPATWASLGSTWDTYTDPWLFAQDVTEGTYDSELIDIGYKATSTVYIEPVVELVTRTLRAWSSFTQPWADYASPSWTWQGLAGAISARYEIATSNDNVTWSAWAPFVTGAYTFRYLKIRVVLATTDPDYRPYLTQLIVRVDVPDRVDHFKDVAVPTSGVTISFSPRFVGVNTAQVTLQSAASGDRFTVTGKSDSQITVNVFDSAGTPKTGLVDVDVFGYGERY